jgi:hypothetical protein
VNEGTMYDGRGMEYSEWTYAGGGIQYSEWVYAGTGIETIDYLKNEWWRENPLYH